METPEAIIGRLRDRLDPVDTPDLVPRLGDGDLNGAPSPTGRTLKQAAVIAPLLLHGGPPRLLLTERASHLNKHAGQIAFPGGRIEPEDTSPMDAALREMHEEVGITQDHVEVIGRFDPYETVTGYCVTPFVGVVHPGYRLQPDPGEVADVFETPFDFLMDPANHQRESGVWQGQERHFYAMPWKNRYIWGATAGMLKSLHDRLYG